MSPALMLHRCEVRVGQVISFPASSSESSSKKQLLGRAEELVSSIASILEDLLMSALRMRTAAEFEAARREVFPKYFEAMHALSSLASIALPMHVLERLSREFFCEMEADCRDHALAAFGAEVRDQLMFTVWTLRKTSDICSTIATLPLAPEIKEKDDELSLHFAYNAIWTRFHLDCLRRSMETKLPIYPEVREMVIDGLRAAVNAYAWARRGLELRSPANDPDPSPVKWDAEDQSLLDEATHEQLSEA